MQIATGTFRAGKGTLDLYLEGENHLYNGIHITLVNFSGEVPEPGELKDLPLRIDSPPLLSFFAVNVRTLRKFTRIPKLTITSTHRFSNARVGALGILVYGRAVLHHAHHALQTRMAALFKQRAGLYFLYGLPDVARYHSTSNINTQNNPGYASTRA